MNNSTIKSINEEKITTSQNTIANKVDITFQNDKKITLEGSGSVKVLTTV